MQTCWPFYGSHFLTTTNQHRKMQEVVYQKGVNWYLPLNPLMLKQHDPKLHTASSFICFYYILPSFFPPSLPGVQQMFVFLVFVDSREQRNLWTANCVLNFSCFFGQCSPLPTFVLQKDNDSCWNGLRSTIYVLVGLAKTHFVIIASK